jgi:hypothetical protein
MQWMAKLKKVNKVLAPYAAFIGTVTLFITTTLTVYGLFFRPHDLSVFVQRQEVNFPQSINDKYGLVWNYLVDSCKDRAVDSAAYDTYTYLQNTNNFWTITLHNEAKRSIRTIIVKIFGVGALSNWAVNGNFLLDDEREKLMKNIKFDASRGVVVLNNIDLLPPHQEIKLYVWGKIPEIVLDNSLSVTYEDGEGHLGHEVTHFSSY